MADSRLATRRLLTTVALGVRPVRPDRRGGRNAPGSRTPGLAGTAPYLPVMHHSIRVLAARTLLGVFALASYLLPASAAAASDAEIWARNEREYVQGMRKNASVALASLKSIDWSRPYCAIGFQERDSRVYFVSTNGLRAGLKPGDQLLSIEGTPFISSPGFDAGYRLNRPGDTLAVKVLRNGEALLLFATCQDARPSYRAYMRIMEAIRSNDWRGCIDAVSESERLDGLSANYAILRGSCAEAQRLKDRRVRTNAEAAYMYESLRREISEARYLPDGFDRLRASYLEALEIFKGSGFSIFASDLERLWQTNEGQPTATVPSETTRVPRKASGTCFAVHPDGLILTAYHVVGEASTIRVRFGDSEFFEAAVVRASPSNDLALLRVARATPDYLTLAATRSVESGQDVFTVGYPAPGLLGEEPKFTDGSVSSTSGPGGEASLIQMSIPIQPGNSGGPVVLSDGQVVGIVTSMAAIKPFLLITGTLPQNVNWAINADYARPLFDPPQKVTTTQTRKEAVERTKKAVCFLEAVTE